MIESDTGPAVEVEVVVLRDLDMALGILPAMENMVVMLCVFVVLGWWVVVVACTLYVAFLCVMWGAGGVAAQGGEL